MLDYINGLFSSIGNWLTHPLRADYPAWKTLLIILLVVIAFLIITDNLRVIREVVEEVGETVVDAVT
jgi:hypothetical protein